MKILLAPLFFISSFCKHCVRIYYSKHPDEWIWQHELRRMPPLGYYKTGSGFVPDFPILIMFDEFLISGEAYERMLAKSAPNWLGVWPRVIRLLDSEGAITPVDIDSELNKISNKRGWMLRRDMRDPSIWSKAMAYHDSLIASADEAYGNHPDEARTPTWELDLDHIPGVRGSNGQGHILSSAPLTDPGEYPNDPHFQLHQLAIETLRRQLREVNAGLSLSIELHAPPMFWAPYQKYLNKKSLYSTDLMTAVHDAENAKLFFEVAFPRYSPDTVDRLRRLRDDKRITQLRSEIRTAAETGNLFDPNYPQRILEEAFHLEKRIGKIRQVAGWINTAIGQIPIPGLGLAATAVSELVGAATEKSLKKKLRWFYLISDGTGYT